MLHKYTQTLWAAPGLQHFVASFIFKQTIIEHSLHFQHTTIISWRKQSVSTGTRTVETGGFSSLERRRKTYEKQVILKLIKSLYGLCDSADYWNATINSLFTKELAMEWEDSDVALYFKFKIQILIESEEFTWTTVSMLLMMSSKDWRSLLFKKIWTKVGSTWMIFFPQDCDENKISLSLYSNPKPLYKWSKEILIALTVTEFQRTRVILSWITNSQPMYACVVNISALIIQDTLLIEPMKDLKKQ